MVASDDKELEAIKHRKIAELQKFVAEKSAIAEIIEPVLLTDSNFSQQVSKYPLLFVDFWAPWCGPCRMVGPIVDQLAKDYAGKVVFGKVNVDENLVIASTFGVQSIPTMILFRSGKAVDVMIGAMPKLQIEAKIKQQLQGPAGGTLYQ